MPKASRAIALLLVGMMVGGFAFATASAQSPVEPTAIRSIVSTSSDSVSPVLDSESAVSTGENPRPSPGESSGDVLGKIASGLRDRALNPGKDFATVVIHTMDVPELGKALEAAGARSLFVLDGKLRERPFVARPWGAVGTPTSVPARVPLSALVDLAAMPSVLYIDQSRTATTTLVQDAAMQEERMGFLQYKDHLKAQVKQSGPRTAGSGSSGVAPTSWAIAREHKAYDAWQLGFMGDGVNVAIIDTGEDFGHPSLSGNLSAGVPGRWAVEQNPASPWFGWPIMFHPSSMLALMEPGFWTAASDVDRLPIPYWLSVNDGDSWYTNTDYKVNDSNLDGYLPYNRATPDFQTSLPQWTPQANPQQYGNWGPTWNAGINRNYYVGCAGLNGSCILSASGIYRLGVHRDDTLTGLWGQKVGILLVDSATPGVYDTVYVDLNFDFNFTNDKPLTQADPIANADLTGDGVPDISGGLLYFISRSTQVTGEVVVPTNSTSASLAEWFDFDSDGTLDGTGVATDITGRFYWDPPLTLWLDDGVTAPYAVPSSTEDIYEEYTASALDETGIRWDFGGPDTTFGPINAINGASYDSARLLRGPGTDYSVSLLYAIESAFDGALAPAVDYSINMADGSVTFLRDFADTDTIFVIYQLDSYTLEPVSGLITFQVPLPVGYALAADYQYGLPIPYSQVFGPQHGFDTFIPANGDLVAFHGEFDNGQSHGSFVSSTVAARPFGNLADTAFEVFGTAPDARVIGIAACCNTAGPLNLFGSIEDQRTFAAVGYDGRPNTGDEGAIMSNSFGDPSTLETGFSWEDRWLIDYWSRYPYITPMIAMANNGPGYGTSTPGGSSPGVIGVGAGTSHDYRAIVGSGIPGFPADGGSGAGEFPDCSGAGSPPDPSQCVGVGSPFGPGPYGDIIYFSSRGPTLLGNPKPDIVSIGGFGLEAGPLNVFAGDPAFLDGNFAFDIFSGTSQATPVTAGVTALIVEAYRTAHGGANPTNSLVKELLKSGADDMHRDVLQQGAGWTNAEASVRSALNTAAWIGTGDGVTSNVDAWTPGNYQGVERIGFANFLNAGSSDSVTVTLTNRNPSSSKTVQITDAVYELAASAYEWPFTLATGAGQNYILKFDGVYSSAGNIRLQSFAWGPYWNASDFVKVTFTYDAVAFPGSTSWRLDTFLWYDADANGLYAGFAERNRMTVAVNGPGANSVWETIYDPDTRSMDGLVLNPRGGAASPLPATLIVEFYSKVNWGWLSTSTGSLLLGSLASAPFTATMTVPAGTAAGYYEGAIYVQDGADTLTIPVVVNVPSASFPIQLGGNLPTTSLYDNNGVIQGSRSTSPWRQTGDSRYVWGTLDVAPPAHPNVGRKLIYNAILQGPKSDPEMFVFNMVPDPDWATDATFGPGTMSLLASTDEIVGATDSSYPNRDIMFSDVLSGLVAFQLKSWSSLAETEQVDANIGLMETTPITHTIATNRYAGDSPLSVWSNVPLYDGLAAAVTTSDTNTTGANNVAANPDYYPGGPFDDWMCSQTPPNVLVRPAVGPVVSRIVNVHITSPSSSDDHDLQVYLDVNNNGLCDSGTDLFLCQSADGDADEQCEASTADGTKQILGMVGIFAPGSDTFNWVIVDIILQIGTSAFCLNAPTTTIPAYTPVQGSICWDFPGSTPAGSQAGLLFISPRYAQFALVQQIDISFRLDFTPPTVDRSRDLAPAPGSTTNEAAVSVAANIGDSAGQIDRFSIQLIVDGVDVTGTSRILAPYSTAAPTGYSLASVTWEHPGMPFSDGGHSAVLNVRDFAGNLRTEVWGWTVDTTGPSLAITSPAADAATRLSSWAFEAWTDPGATATVRMNGVPQTITLSPEGQITATLGIPTDGPYAIDVTVADAVGNERTGTRNIVRDARSPVIAAGVDVSTLTNARSTTVSGSVDETVTSLWVNDMAVSVGADGSFTTVVPLAEGSNSIVIQATDGAGNPASVTLPTITRDTVAPTIRLDAYDPVITVLADQTVWINGTADAAGLFFVTINGLTVSHSPTTGRFTSPAAGLNLAVGDNTFVVMAQDQAGNVGMAVASISYAPVVTRDVPNYNGIIASGVAVVLLIVGFLVGWMLAGRGGAPPTEAAAAEREREEDIMREKEEAMAEEELPPEEPKKPEEEEL